MLPGSHSQLQGHVQQRETGCKPWCRKKSVGPLKQSQQGKDVAPPEKVTAHPASTSPEQCMVELSGMAAGQDTENIWLDTQPPHCWLYPKCLLSPLNWLCCKAGDKAGDWRSWCPAVGETFRASASAKALLYCLASSCPESGAPLALCGTNPGVVRPRPAPTSAGMRHRPHPSPSSCHSPTAEADSLQSKLPGTGRGEEQRKCVQQAVTFSQEATHVQPSQGLALTCHHTMLTSAPLWVLLLWSTYFQQAQRVCSLGDM